MRDEKTFIISAGEDDMDDSEDESEDEMIKEKDMDNSTKILISPDNDRYKALHSHVQQYNKREAAVAASKIAAFRRYETLTTSHHLITNEKTNMAHFLDDDEKPFLGGFKHELDKVRRLFDYSLGWRKNNSYFYFCRVFSNVNVTLIVELK